MRCFITGTDTEVGKSVATACLAEAAKSRGTAIAAKPVASGVAPGTDGEDAELLAAAAEHPPVIWRRYTPPVSPHRAILDGGQPIDPQVLRRDLQALSADTVLVEGVGGWRVPIQLEPRIECVDLARWTGGAVIVVARDRLGVLNHTRLTVDAIRADGLEVAGIILNRLPGDPELPSNLLDLRLLHDLPIAVLDPIDPHRADQRLRAGLSLWMGLSGAGPTA